MAELSKSRSVSFLKEQLPPALLFVLVLSSNIGVLLLFVDFAGTQFVNNFKLQNTRELSSGKIFDVSARLSASLRNVPWICAEAKKDGEVFYDQKNSTCNDHFFARWYTVDLRDQGGVEIRALIGPDQKWYFFVLIASLLELSVLLVYTILVSSMRAKAIKIEADLVTAKAAASQAELEAKLATSSAIASTTSALAHDVRKPFSMLKMVLNSILNAETPLEAQEIAKGSLPEIAQSLVTVDGMIQDVMQIGSNSKPNQEIASPDTIIENTLNEVFRIFPDAKVDIEYDLQHRRSLFVDTLRTARVFSNIICNALQAMEAKGLIWIKTAEHADFLEFRLGNMGSCIPAENLPKLFDAFFTSDKKGGTGLGLAIAKKVVNEHGGAIRCDSERNGKYPNGFVEFIFTMPLSADLCEVRTLPLPGSAKEVHAQFASMKSKNPQTSSTDEIALEIELSQKVESLGVRLPSLLIVDDEAVYRNSLANLLHQGKLSFAKIPILFAKNYDETLEHCKGSNPFLIIQDLDLGSYSKNGIETILELRKQNFKGRICVHSNRFLFGDQKEAIDAGADAVMPKPMSRLHLMKIILHALVNEQREANLDIPVKSEIQMKESPRRISLAFLDDTKTFTMIWKLKLKILINIETFSSTTDFLKRSETDPDFISSFDIIVTDYHFAESDPHNGKTFATSLRKMGYKKPIMLASNGDFSTEDLKPDLNGCVGKEVPSLQEIESWLKL